MYFKSILVFTAIIFWNNLLNSQITKVDSQWYVLNYEGRSFGSVGTTGQYPYLNQMVDGNSVVKIIGTSTPSTYLPCLAPTPPANPNPCVLNIPRNDLFIIYKDGSYYNSIDLATPLPWTSPEFNFNSTKKIAYLYFSNIYEEDDPPQSIRVENQSSGISNDLPAHTPPNNIMTTNHDIVRGKDLTLIIPHQIPISCASINLHISNALYDDDTPVLISGNQVPILKLNKVFDNNWSYHLNAGTPLNNSNNYVSQINNITFPSGIKYHFFNFNADFENDPNLIGKTVKIEAYCSANPAVPIATLTTAISDIHDPNFIEVKCIYKKKKPWYCPFSQDRYFVKYFVQFMNDGDMPVNSVIVNFNLPDIAIPSTFRVGNWKYGSEQKCGLITNSCFYPTPTDPNVSIQFSNSSLSYLAAQDPTNLGLTIPTQFGSFEFCVEINRDPTLFNYESLQPESPTTNFDGVVYPIQNFKDPYYTDKVLVEGVNVTLKKRKITTDCKICNCKCPPQS
ncbi:MAG: hypothetical protein IPO78_00800 [Saprospiraceae bacterium]|nr:hypothetical protein [Saprospiraceae bacterium]